jgi:hypothetical protein
MPLTYIDDLQESAPLLFLTFLAGLWAIRDNNVVILAISFLIGGLNNETMLVLPLVYLLYNYRSRKIGDLALLLRNTILTSLPLVLPVGIIRFISKDRPHLVEVWQLPNNINGLLDQLWNLDLLHLYNASYLYIFFIFGAFWIYAFVRYRGQPLFQRRASLMIPFFIAANLVTGIIAEVRLMLPLSCIIIPMALFSLFPFESHQDTSMVGNPANGSHSFFAESRKRDLPNGGQSDKLL